MEFTDEERDRIKAHISRILYRIGAIKFGTFKLTSGILSSYYIDLRLIPSFPEIFHLVSDALASFIKSELKEERIDRVAGIPTAGIPFASVLAYILNKPFLYIRKTKKLHGRERRVEGVISPGDHVLLIDDLITTGGSIIKAAKAITAEGGVIEHVVVLIDREEGGAKRLLENGIKLHAIFKVREIAQTLYDMGAIDEDQLNMIRKQIKE